MLQRNSLILNRNN